MYCSFLDVCSLAWGLKDVFEGDMSGNTVILARRWAWLSRSHAFGSGPTGQRKWKRCRQTDNEGAAAAAKRQLAFTPCQKRGRERTFHFIPSLPHSLSEKDHPRHVAKSASAFCAHRSPCHGCKSSTLDSKCRDAWL